MLSMNIFLIHVTDARGRDMLKVLPAETLEQCRHAGWVAGLLQPVNGKLTVTLVTDEENESCPQPSESLTS